MDAYPLLLFDASRESEDAALPTLLWRIVDTRACLIRSVAIIKLGQTTLGAAHTRLTRKPAYPLPFPRPVSIPSDTVQPSILDLCHTPLQVPTIQVEQPVGRGKPQPQNRGEQGAPEDRQ
jgi:hypothetical protein